MAKKAAAAAAGETKEQPKKLTPEEKAAKKLLEANIKEGGKKGQDPSGMHDLGGMNFFTVCIPFPSSPVSARIPEISVYIVEAKRSVAVSFLLRIFP